MTNKELAEQTRKALAEFNRLPPEEQVKRLVAYGTINVHGEVLMGQEDRSKETQNKPAE